jgi:hypothetical protein
MEAGWDRCMHFLARKQRYCNMARTPGQQYCGVHLAASSKGERIRCPVDPSHTVWSGLLAAHVKVCNTATANKMLESMPYYQKVRALGQGDYYVEGWKVVGSVIMVDDGQDINSGDAPVEAEEGSLHAIDVSGKPFALCSRVLIVRV